MTSNYTIETWYSYNVFGADEHYNVGLYRGKKLINAWSYHTFMMNRLAHSRAERRIARLRATYNASVV